MLDNAFLTELKRATEVAWGRISINAQIYGYQFQTGTRWNAGLSPTEIDEYECVLGVRFPDDFKIFLRAMNGTDLATVNVFGTSNTPPRESVGVYSYPRDIEIVKTLIEHIRPSRTEIAAHLDAQGFDLPQDANLVPIFSNRYLVCSSDLNSSVVLSLVVNDIDAIVYESSLRGYLEKEFL